MLILIFFAFLAGVVTILSPCILPVLPIVLTVSISGGKRRPLGVVVGFVVSFSLFTLFLASLVKLLGIPADFLRNLAIVVIFLFGLSILIPKFQLLLERLFARFSKFAPRVKEDSGFVGGLTLGATIGLLWTPCVGPILASVIALALAGTVSGAAVVITFSYALGTAVPMLLILRGGRVLLAKVPWLTQNTQKIQKVFGVIMMLTAVAIFFNFDRSFQEYILQKFPSYGIGLTKIEENSAVNSQLGNLQNSPTANLGNYGKAPALIAGGEWFNSKPLTLAALRGRVVLVDFWTYTCINCIRTLPYTKAWYEKYAADGFIIIGVHTPEFEFEKIPDNVSKAVGDFNLKYPVMQDNDYATWRAYNNHYWPAKYLIDKDGVIRYEHFGEGDYDATEAAIQELLKEAGSTVSGPIDNPTYTVEALTPELYLGYGRAQFLENASQVSQDKKKTYVSYSTPRQNYFTFDGDWQVGEEYVMPFTGASLTLNFSAKEVYLVMRPTGTPGVVKVYLDGDLVTSAAGEDVSAGQVTVDTDRLYKLIKLDSPGQHVLKLEFQDSNVELYAFTFG